MKVYRRKKPMSDTIKVASKGFHPLTMRCTFQEEECIQKAAEISDLPMSNFVVLTLVESLNLTLGMSVFDDTPPRLRVGYQWPFAPQRADGDSAKTRLNAYIPKFMIPAVAAAHFGVHLTLPAFTIGSALRGVAYLKIVNERNKKLKNDMYQPEYEKLVVPYGFEDIVRSAK